MGKNLCNIAHTLINMNLQNSPFEKTHIIEFCHLTVILSVLLIKRKCYATTFWVIGLTSGDKVVCYEAEFVAFIVGIIGRKGHFFRIANIASAATQCSHVNELLKEPRSFGKGAQNVAEQRSSSDETRLSRNIISVFDHVDSG